jgi:hypothetical protein
MSKTDQSRVGESGDLKSSSMMEGPGEKHPPMDKRGSERRAPEGSDPSFTSGLPEMKHE